MSEEKELVLYLGVKNLKEKLGLPKDAVIISVYEEWLPIAGERHYCIRYSTKEAKK